VLRLEKAHILAGQDTDSESNLLEASMPWILKLDKGDFVGRWSAEHVKARGIETRLVGFRIDTDDLPAEGGQIVDEGRPVGRITSARRSEAVDAIIGLAWVPADKAVEGAGFEVRVNGRLVAAEVTLKPFYDPEGRLLRS
jgi:glycine cleavage system aminomethyltransferase T